MSATRRQFLRTSVAYAAGFAGLRALVHPSLAQAAPSGTAVGFGPLISDPEGILDLPKGFSYKIVSQLGDKMDDGLLVSSAPDGMAAFEGPEGTTIVVRNHEAMPGMPGPFGKDDQLIEKIGYDKLYDDGNRKTPGLGGTSTFVYDTKQQKLVRQFQSLAGTERNCAGGPTPWGSWITCEETVDKPGHIYKGSNFEVAKAHGYNFEVPATAEPMLADPVPLIEMGRFRHEAIAVDPRSGAIYQTEDLDDGAFYRFLPNKPGIDGNRADLAAGGRLQALAIVDQDTLDTRNWGAQHCQVGQQLAVRWIDLTDPESPNDDLRYQAQGKGAAIFARGEGLWHIESDDSTGAVYFACTSGGKAEIGQIWKYTPSSLEGQAQESSEPGTLELFIEPNDTNLVHNADNLTVAPWGDLVVCEDRQGDVVRLIGVTPAGECYTLANNQVRGEFAGACFSPDGSTLFVNLQTKGLTLAITGPWQA